MTGKEIIRFSAEEETTGEQTYLHLTLNEKETIHLVRAMDLFYLFTKYESKFKGVPEEQILKELDDTLKLADITYTEHFGDYAYIPHGKVIEFAAYCDEYTSGDRQKYLEEYLEELERVVSNANGSDERLKNSIFQPNTTLARRELKKFGFKSGESRTLKSWTEAYLGFNIPYTIDRISNKFRNPLPSSRKLLEIRTDLDTNDTDSAFDYDADQIAVLIGGLKRYCTSPTEKDIKNALSTQMYSHHINQVRTLLSEKVPVTEIVGKVWGVREDECSSLNGYNYQFQLLNNIVKGVVEYGKY